MLTYHYLGGLQKIGNTLWYVAIIEDEWVALLIFSAAALICSVRDAWIGWGYRHQYDRLNLVAVLRMKKSKLKYRITDTVDGRQVQQDLDAKALYLHSARKQWQRITGQKYQAIVVDVEVKLTEYKKSSHNGQRLGYCLYVGQLGRNRLRWANMIGRFSCVGI